MFLYLGRLHAASLPIIPKKIIVLTIATFTRRLYMTLPSRYCVVYSYQYVFLHNYLDHSSAEK